LGAFGRLDTTRVHVALLGDWENDVYTLGQDASARQHVVGVLGVRESRRFVFRRMKANQALHTTPPPSLPRRSRRG
jgi:hypothetical protein